MKVTFLGTLAGMEPVSGRLHTSLVVESNRGLYWFDAGEGCSRTAHLLGLDLLAVRAIFISHCHPDHIGGFPNLLWTLQKLNRSNGDASPPLGGATIPVIIPDLAVLRSVLKLAAAPKEQFEPGFTLDPRLPCDGLVFDEAGFTVSALHNRHLGEPPPGEPWRSFSFRLEASGKSVVFSGDVKDVRELDPFLDDCDLFLMETGHHQVESICRHLRDRRIGKLGFLHHGRAVVDDLAGETRKARSLLGDRVFFADDGMSIEV